ncbi:uncharacterized protein BO96DRAFT_34634 [Aspergillus niger CBS 101883]|uniref:uncharacterized protein n=1 Tax=Aspergillus lacticoffeatus (strain CBS 101883) TaxID=1450533 RepID=UPI000D8057C6|nr:uncharacterized protein BO96DRAFT_34634 [Aspergillus niger CBS 101883]PYH57242.1 hypothetical protein BO96DRAFT_34634 [Aspergillus niger CBS 101883]
MGSCVRWFARSDQHLSQSLAGGSYLPGTMLGSHRAFFPPKPAVPLVAMKTFSSSILACRGDPLCDVVIALSSGSLISAPCERSIQLLNFHRKSTHCASSLFGDYHTTIGSAPAVCVP